LLFRTVHRELSPPPRLQFLVMNKTLRCLVMLVALSVLLSLAGCTKWGEKKHPNWRQATSGEHLVNLFWKDVKEKKFKELDRHVASEFMGTNEMATLDKPALLEHVSHLEIESFQIGEVQTKPAGRDLIVSYVMTLRLKSPNGTSREMRLRLLSVWQELKRGWVVIAMSSSHMDDAAPSMTSETR
jgi:hypothetical protein